MFVIWIIDRNPDLTLYHRALAYYNLISCDFGDIW